MRRLSFALSFVFVLAVTVAAPVAHAQEKWVTGWAASVQGPYPVGNPSAQSDPLDFGITRVILKP
jgi:hypothetical protein